MKKYFVLSAVGLAMAGAHAQAPAPGAMYGELGYTAAKMTASGAGDRVKSSPDALRGIFGLEINPYLAVEGMLGLGLRSASVKVNGVTEPGEKLKIEHMLGAYVKPKYAVNDSLEVFARLGLSHSKLKDSLNGQTDTFTRTGLGYGAGLSVAVNKSISLNADYMQYLNKDNIKLNGFTFGVGYKF